VSENIHTNSIEAVLTSDSALGLTEARAYRNGTDIQAAQPGPALDFNDTTQVAHVQQLFKIGSDNTFRLATEYQHDRIGVTPVGGAALASQVLAAAAMWEVKLQPTMTVNDAVRVDTIAYSRNGYLPPVLGLTNAEWDRHFTEWSFNSGLVWSLSDLDRLRFTVARGVQMPSLAAFGAVLLPLPYPGLYDGGNPLLQPTIDQHYEIGWSRSLPTLGALFALSAYHDDIRGAPAQFGNQVTLSPNLVGGPINLGDTHSYGLELSLKGHAGDHWRWGLGYSPETIKDNFAGHPVQVTLVDFEDTTPKHTADAQLGWSGGAWELDAFLQYQSADYGVRGLSQNIPGAILVRIPAYLTADARLAYQLTRRATFALSGQNLLHQQQIQTAISPVERRVLATLSYRF
jgi:iron complex outermembrane receptor protein